jgi:hypothetical protein
MCEEAHKFKLKRVNSEGFRDPGKHLFVQEAIREHCLDFIALLRRDGQTLRCVFLIISLPAKNFCWFCLLPHGRSGGILVGINSETVHVNHVEMGDSCVKLKMCLKMMVLNGLLFRYMAQHKRSGAQT